MRLLVSAFLLSLFYSSIYAEEVTVLAASGTSNSNISDNVTCLLDDNCTGIWQPDSQDEGVDEGLYFQFEEPVLLHSIKVFAEKKPYDKPSYLNVYLNGKTTSPDDIVYIVNTENVDADKKKTTYTIEGRDQQNYKGSLYTKVKSVFIKINKGYERSHRPTFKSLQFFKHIKVANSKEVKVERVKFKLPRIITAKISASSVLSPVTAYQPANLFDSKYDFAWSTDGNNTDGINEELSLAFPSKINLSGLYVWNGYQRSSTHFNKNARVKLMVISSDNGAEQEVSLSSVSGLQKIIFTNPLLGVSTLKLKIKDIFPGSKYKDVLISELRLIDDKGRIVLPFSQKKSLEIKTYLKDVVDRSWSSFLHGIAKQEYGCAAKCFYKRIRIRKNGSFVIYRDMAYGNDGSQSANVLEGNWVYDKNMLRIFGKKYTTSLTSSDYMKGQAKATVPSAKIFQSFVTIKRYNELTKKEKSKLFVYLTKNRVETKESDKGLVWAHNYDKIQSNEIIGDDISEVNSSLDKTLRKINPLYIKSSVITDLFLPTEDVSECSEFC